jgi:hypothetical protein
MKFEFSSQLKNKVKEVCTDYTELVSLVERNSMAAMSYLEGSYLMAIPFPLYKSCKESGDFSRINELVAKSEKMRELETQMHEEINIWQSDLSKL